MRAGSFFLIFRYVEGHKNYTNLWTIEFFEQQLWYDDELQELYLPTKEDKKKYKKFMNAMAKVTKRHDKEFKKLEKKGLAETLF